MSRCAVFDVHLCTFFEGRSRSGSRALLERAGTGTGTAEGLASCGLGGAAQGGAVARLSRRSCVRAVRPVEEATPTSVSARCRPVWLESVRSSVEENLLKVQEVPTVSVLLERPRL